MVVLLWTLSVYDLAGKSVIYIIKAFLLTGMSLDLKLNRFHTRETYHCFLYSPLLYGKIQLLLLDFSHRWEILWFLLRNVRTHSECYPHNIVLLASWLFRLSYTVVATILWVARSQLLSYHIRLWLLYGIRTQLSESLVRSSRWPFCTWRRQWQDSRKRSVWRNEYRAIRHGMICLIATNRHPYHCSLILYYLLFRWVVIYITPLVQTSN